MRDNFLNKSSVILGQRRLQGAIEYDRKIPLKICHASHCVKIVSKMITFPCSIHRIGVNARYKFRER